MRNLFVLGLAAVATAACATAQPTAYPGGNSADRYVCVNTMLAQFKGRPATAETGIEIVRSSGSKTLQWIPHGTMVTQEFRPDRVRIYLDAQNKVDRASCG